MVVGILKGSLVFMADLIRSVTIPLSIDYVAISVTAGRRILQAWSGL